MSDIVEKLNAVLLRLSSKKDYGTVSEAADEITRLREENAKLAQLSAKASQEASQLRAALSEAYDKGRRSRGEVVAAGHALFVYAQKVARKIKHHSLEKLISLPDDELLAFIRAVGESSKSARAAAAALEEAGDE